MVGIIFLFKFMDSGKKIHYDEQTRTEFKVE
jgi:hypothetical protein